MDDETEDIFDHISSLPPLATRTQVDEESLLAAATDRLKLTFTALLTKVRLSLQKFGVTPESLLSHLKSVEAIGLNFESVYTFRSKSFGRTISKPHTSLEDLFPAIAPYCSWFNHLLVENIIETFCDDDEGIQQKWKAFKEKFTKYCEARLCKCPQDQFGEDCCEDISTSVVMKIDAHWRTVKVKQLAIIRDTVSELLSIKPYNLYLRAVKNGCVELLFHVPTFVAVKFIPPSAEQVLALQKACVIKLQCDPGFVSRRHVAFSADVSTMRSFFAVKDFSGVVDVAQYLSGSALQAYTVMLKSYRQLRQSNIGFQLRRMGDILETRMMANQSIFGFAYVFPHIRFLARPYTAAVVAGVPFAIAHALIFPHILARPYSEVVVAVYLAGGLLYTMYAFSITNFGRYLNLWFPNSDRFIRHSFYLFLHAPVVFILPFQLFHLCRNV